MAPGQVGNEAAHHRVFKKVSTISEPFLEAVVYIPIQNNIAGWRSLASRKAHNLEAAGSNPAPATNRAQAQVTKVYLKMLTRINHTWPTIKAPAGTRKMAVVAICVEHNAIQQPECGRDTR